MPLIDDRGRLFGRVNVIDATIVGFVVVLMPIIYTASRLLLVPKPVIERVEPAAQLAGPARRIRVIGRNLRPDMRAVASPTGFPSLVDPATWADPPLKATLVSPSLVELELGDLKAGPYDIRLFDSTEEVARLTHAFALTVPAQKPKVEKQAVARVIVRFAVLPQIAALVHPGDSAVADPAAPAGDRPAPPQPAAVIRNVRVVVENLPATIDYGFGWGTKLIETDIDMPLHQNARGEWVYRQDPIHVGDSVIFQTTRYTLRGVIGGMTVSSIADVALDASEVK